MQPNEESQASGAASFRSSPSKLTHSDMGPPAHKTVSMQELTAANGTPRAGQAPRIRFPARPGMQNGGVPSGNLDSPQHEQAASCNDPGAPTESGCVTPHNQLKVRRGIWRLSGAMCKCFLHDRVLQPSLLSLRWPAMLPHVASNPVVHCVSL